MCVRMKVDELSEGLSAGDDIATSDHLTINVDGGLPSVAGQLAQQTAILEAENLHPPRNREDVW